MTEKRQAPRQKSFLHGFVYFGKSTSAINCLVRDITDTGARLKFSAPPISADYLELQIPVRGACFRAKVQWRRGTDIGVAFDLAAASPQFLASRDRDLSNKVSALEAEILALKRMVKKLEEKSSQVEPIG